MLLCFFMSYFGNRLCCYSIKTYAIINICGINKN